jgi:hypothetical protein
MELAEIAHHPNPEQQSGEPAKKAAKKVSIHGKTHRENGLNDPGSRPEE